MSLKNPTYIFFGTGYFAEPLLNHLKTLNFLPSYIVTSPDKPSGRHQIMTPPRVKIFAEENDIPIFQPAKLKSEESMTELRKIIDGAEGVVIADYGKMLPQILLDLSPTGFINIHPSLLPEYRGPTPVHATILNNNPKTGVTLIKIDALMDHGPIIAQEPVFIDETIWPLPIDQLYEILAKKSAELLAHVLPEYLTGNVTPREQDHDKATIVKFIDKADAEVHPLTDSIADIYLKFQAYKLWPGIFFMNNGKRVKIKDMNGAEILRVTPEGKPELDYKEYVKYHPLA
ncbi:MAG: hypothetical protein RJB39_209 [Candidatus Parcubacteria bacterium]|jgi:methionyl-tRNA formyltransferase